MHAAAQGPWRKLRGQLYQRFLKRFYGCEPPLAPAAVMPRARVEHKGCVLASDAHFGGSGWHSCRVSPCNWVVSAVS
eukprot:3210640-Pleurochrysis_carterae.AAC.1